MCELIDINPFVAHASPPGIVISPANHFLMEQVLSTFACSPGGGTPSAEQPVRNGKAERGRRGQLTIPNKAFVRGSND